MSAPSATSLDKENRELLVVERARLEAERDRLRNVLAAQRFPGWFNNRGSDLWYALRKIEDLEAIERALAEDPEARLVFLDMRFGARGKAAIAIGDVDVADRVSVAVPGMNTTPGRSMVDMAREAKALRDCATAILRGQGSGETVACVGWIGYETPHAELDLTMLQSRRFGPGWGDGAVGAVRLLSAERAKRGAVELAQFLRWLRFAGSGAPERPSVTALGHSYGSLTTSFALRRLPKGVVGDVVFFGSPGIRAASARKLRLEPGHVFAMLAEGDMIRRAGSWFGGSVVEAPWIQRLSTRASVGPGDGQQHDRAWGHADYPRLGENGQLRITGYNMACVLAGRPDLAVRGA
ncbi:MAG: alpha/beta hydrolase [Segniliparus sp.]|uniref:alpha/beta hydrolase n=1 Tax=Segniliparus sp. TaxID=2804064 RepID=UPI003F3E2809